MSAASGLFMTVKSSVSLTDSQAAFARALVEEGRYSSLSAVLQRGLEMLRDEREAKDAATGALRAFFEERAKGPFVSAAEFARLNDASLKRAGEAWLAEREGSD